MKYQFATRYPFLTVTDTPAGNIRFNGRGFATDNMELALHLKDKCKLCSMVNPDALAEKPAPPPPKEDKKGK